ncbi:MAG: DUF721 domain-containing protein [Proteobacteria bacterium]|nr:DUF721 domain-containing protein [Pseudomonadota bacterium]
MSDNNFRRPSLFPKTLGDCIEPLTRPAMKANGLAGSRILTEWASIVGPQLAAHSAPEKLSFPRGAKTGGTLTISTESGFAPQLQHMQPIILERLASYFGYAAISRITISHSWARPAEKAPPRKPPTLPKGSASITHEVEDPELRAALVSLAKTLAGEA